MADSVNTKGNKISTEETSKSSTTAEAPSKGPQINTKRCSLLTIGMAGSGKTTFVKVIKKYNNELKNVIAIKKTHEFCFFFFISLGFSIRFVIRQR